MFLWLGCSRSWGCSSKQGNLDAGPLRRTFREEGREENMLLCLQLKKKKNSFCLTPLSPLASALFASTLLHSNTHQELSTPTLTPSLSPLLCLSQAPVPGPPSPVCLVKVTTTPTRLNQGSQASLLARSAVSEPAALTPSSWGGFPSLLPGLPAQSSLLILLRSRILECPQALTFTHLFLSSFLVV